MQLKWTERSWHLHSEYVPHRYIATLHWTRPSDGQRYVREYIASTRLEAERLAFHELLGQLYLLRIQYRTVHNPGYKYQRL